MDLYVLNRDFQQIGIVDTFDSLIWTKRYYAFGDCEVYISANARNLGLLAIGNYLIRTDDWMICRITSSEIETNTEEGNHIIVKGVDCREILNQRIVYKQTSFRGSAENFIRTIITDNLISAGTNRSIPNFTLGEYKGYTDSVDLQSTFDYVGTKVIEVCRKFGIGSKVTFENGNFVFELYKGVDRSYSQDANDFVVFSPEFDNLASTVYKKDVSNYYSMAIVAGTGEGVNRLRTDTDPIGAVGLDRYELFVDAKDVSQEISYDDLISLYPGGTVDVNGKYVLNGAVIATVNNADEPTNAKLDIVPYLQMLVDRGTEKLAETGVLFEFDGEVEPNHSYELGIDYNLGDIVQVENEYGVSVSARITEVIECFDKNGYSVIPTFDYEEL